MSNKIIYKGGYYMEQYTQHDTQQLLELINVPIINDDTNYWFVRTNGGEKFEDFYFKNYIAIAWDKLNDLEFIKEGNNDLLKQQVEQLYPQETKPGSVSSQILRFVNEMKIGDYVMIPGTNCDRIAFGKITGEAYIYEPTFEEKFDVLTTGEDISFFKRRSVEWLTTSPFERNELDPMLIPIIYSYGTIVSANPYATFINRTLYSQYYYKGMFHSIIDVNKKTNISLIDFNNLINGIFSTIDSYSELSGFEIDKKELSIRATINSPGPVEIITAATSVFICLSAIAIFLNGANTDFSFNIFNIASGQIKIDSPGLLDKIENLIKTSNDKKIKENEKTLLESKEKLEVKKKKKKK